MATTRRTQARHGGLPGRITQFIETLSHRHSPDIDQRIRLLLGDDSQWLLVARLSSFDRGHVLAVHDLLIERGHADCNLLRAALLHDVGKSDGIRQVKIWDRTARVLGRRWMLGLWRTVASNRRRATTGFYLAEHHAEIGSNVARAAGVSLRCAELIRRHEEQPPTGDELLDALIFADGDV